MRTALVLLASIAIIATMASAALAEPPPDVTADQAVALYREHSARRAANRAGIEVTAADVVEAGIHPNPTIGFNHGRTVSGDTAGPGRQYGIDLQVPLLLGHQRSRREHAANLHVESTRADVAADEVVTEHDIRTKFAALQAAQQRTAVYAGALDDTRAVRGIVAGRSAAGATSTYALERIDLAIANTASKLDDARAEELSASSELAGAIGIPGWHPRAVGTLAAVPAPPTTIANQHPALVAKRAAEAAARADEDRAHADAFPVPNLDLQAYTTNDPTGIAIVAGISIPLPIFDRNQGAVARARAQAHRANLEITAQTEELAADLDRASRVLVARREALARFTGDALERLPRVRSMAESAYRAGQGGIIELLDALDAITEAKLREIELLAGVVEADLAVRAAAGV
jgi:outer membrane protein, heavy metal efflux system